MDRNDALAFLGGIGLGAGLAFVLDPASGRRRRALARDRVAHLGISLRDWVEERRTHLGNRAHGSVSSLRGRWQREPVSDDILRERLRAQLGHATAHLDEIEIDVDDGRVELHGVIAPHELPVLLARVWRVPGVLDVRNRLELRPGVMTAPEVDDAAEAVAAADGRSRAVLGYALLGIAGAAAALLTAARNDQVAALVRAGQRALVERVRPARGLRGRARRLLRQVA